MSQQINLYQPILRRPRKVFSAQTLAYIGLVIAIGLGLIFAYSRWQLTQLRAEVAQLEAQKAQAEQQMAELAAAAEARRDDRELSRRSEELRAEIAARTHLIAWLGARAAEPGPKFSAFLAGLARQHQGELWLEEVRLAEGGRAITLIGASHDPAAVVRYLRRLGAEPAFQRVEFDRVSIERREQAAAELRFEVSNAPLESP
jgi:Tfp pilus assembly protein PilN